MADSIGLHIVAQPTAVCCTGADYDVRKAAVAAAPAALAAPAERRPDPETDLVLSDVHIGRAPSATQQCITVFRFTSGWAPPGCDAGGSADAPGSGSGGVDSYSSCGSRDSPQPAVAVLLSSGAAPAQLDEDGDVVVKRRRRSTEVDAAGAAEGRLGSGMAGGIVMHHAMATSLHNVGKQVSMLVDGCIPAVLCHAGPPSWESHLRMLQRLARSAAPGDTSPRPAYALITSQQ